MKKLLILISLVMFAMGITGCNSANQNYFYSILRGGAESWSGTPDERVEKETQYYAYLKSLNISSDVRIISASSREEANKIAEAWLNQEVSKVDNNIVNSFVPLKVYLTYKLQTRPEVGDTFVPFGELKEFGDLSLKK